MMTGITHTIRKNSQKVLLVLGFFMLLPFGADLSAQQQRFPEPEFMTPYTLPETTTPMPRSNLMEYVDVLVLAGVMALTLWLVFKRRSRRWILWTTVFALLYFGFYRNGCICPIGAVQNFVLALSGSGYVLPITVLAFFLLPLILSLFAGRIFCASACPLGAIQDILVFKPVKVPPWVRHSLGIFPFVYLGLAVLFAVTGSDFIICRYDPYVGIFRMSAEFPMAVFGISFLLVGAFVARPYCRFVCPYGAMLKVTSTFSKHHLSITPTDCINCKLCKDSCPFDAIDAPTDAPEHRIQPSERKQFLRYILLIPIFVLITGWAVSSAHHYLARAHPDVQLARMLLADPSLMHDETNLDITTFMASGRTLEMLVEDAGEVTRQFKAGSRYLGGFLGLVIALTLLQQLTYRRRTIYQANRSNCLSCGRCMDFCPVGKPDHPWFIENPDHLIQETQKHPNT